MLKFLYLKIKKTFQNNSLTANKTFFLHKMTFSQIALDCLLHTFLIVTNNVSLSLFYFCKIFTTFFSKTNFIVQFF